MEQPVKGESDEDRGGRGVEIADDAETEEQFVGSDVSGCLGGVVAGEQSAGNVFKADDREAEEQVQEAGNSA